MLEESSPDTLDQQKEEQVSASTNEASNITGDKVTKVKLCYFWHIMRQAGSLEMTIMPGKMQAAGKEE